MERLSWCWHRCFHRKNRTKFNRRENRGKAQRTQSAMKEDLLTRTIIGLAIDVHTALGPGLLENAYKECLFYKINKAGFQVEKKK